MEYCQNSIDKFKPDIFLRQENWLYGFQHYKLGKVHPRYDGSGISFDSNNPAIVSGLERAKWGLDILWKKELSHQISILSDLSNPRFQVLQYNNISKTPLIIINVYLPTTANEAEYDSVIIDLC